MALMADIHVNGIGVGRVSCVRASGGIGQRNTYRCSGFTLPHPLTGEEVDVREVVVEHDYNASPIELMAKAMAAIAEAHRDRPVM